MRLIAITSVFAFSLVAPYAVLADTGMTVPSVTLGRNLQVHTGIAIAPAAPEGGLTLTLTSDDPSRLLLSEGPDKAGSATIAVKVIARARRSNDFWLHGLADSGTATYTVSAEGIGSVKGTVTLLPSTIVIIGLHGKTKILTGPRRQPDEITVVSAALGSSPIEQQVAGGSKVEVTIANSNPTAGTLQASKLTLAGGSSTAKTFFQPTDVGETTISPIQPPGFVAPTERATIVATVVKPGIALLTNLLLGKDLQVGGQVIVAAPAPPGGLKVTLTSADSSKLLLSSKVDQAGAGSLTVTVPEGKESAPYFVQGIGDSGNVTYDATAPGYVSRTATIGLTKAGFIVGLAASGPPERKNVEGKETADRPGIASLSAKEHTINIRVWPAYLDRERGRAADITVQTVRGGATATVVLKSSDPAIGTVESPLTFKSGTDFAETRFTPLSKGTTVISIDTPAGYTKPNNATSLPMIVRE